MLLFVLLGWMSGTPLATLLPGGEDGWAGDDRSRLALVRERLDRRVALERRLRMEIQGAATTVDRLRRERDQRAAELSRARDEVRRLERELDRIVPRSVAEEALGDRRRTTSATALATLAGISRRAEIDPGVRARLLAVSPVMFERLRSRPGALSALETKGARLAERHRHLRGTLPDLLASRAQVELDRGRAARRHEVLAREHAELRREIARLTAAEKGLAQAIMAAERIRSVDAGAPLNDAAARQSALPKVSFAAAPVSRAVSAAGRSVQGSAGERSHLAGRLEAQPFSPPPAKPSGPLLVVDRARIDAPADRADVEIARVTRTATVEGTTRLHPPARPITPSPAALLDPVLQAVETRPVITMPARRGQPVAAPDDGRTAFAGEFGSYGLLLILEHEREYHTILWGFSSLHVATGDPVRSGQIIGDMGRDGGDLELHVEFRRNGRPVGALPWLAASSSKVRG